MIGFAKMGSDPFAVQAGDNIFWIDAININRNQPFTRRIINAANDMAKKAPEPHGMAGRSGKVVCVIRANQHSNNATKANGMVQ